MGVGVLFSFGAVAFCRLQAGGFLYTLRSGLPGVSARPHLSCVSDTSAPWGALA